jgi:4-hydroxyphenylpyruvate dioxygenase-like putative hemolysin
MAIPEIYARDGEPWARALKGLGFQVGELVDRGDRSTFTASGGRAWVRVSVPAGRYTRPGNWLEEHGDGAAEIVLPVADPVGAYRRAVAAGAYGFEPGFTVSIAGVMYTFVWPPPHLARPGPFTALDHVALAVRADSLASTVLLYLKAFEGSSWTPMPQIVVGGQGMDSGVIRVPGLTVTVVAPDPARAPGQVDEFLKAHNGPGIQHVAFAVPDIVSTVLETSVAGTRYLKTPGSYFDAVEERLGAVVPDLPDLRATGVLVDVDELGWLRQIFTAPPVPPSPFFWELIQRDGAEGFGLGNIAALYEAKRQFEERETS